MPTQSERMSINILEPDAAPEIHRFNKLKYCDCTGKGLM